MTICLAQNSHAEQKEYYERIGDEVWAWYVTDWQGAYQAQLSSASGIPYPITPIWKLGRKEGEYLVYAHRYIICPYCDNKYSIGFAGPFTRTKCQKCGKEFEERIGLYKWQKSIKGL